MMAVLKFIFGNAVKYEVDAKSMFAELEQLGIPNDIVRVICKLYATVEFDNVRKHIEGKVLKCRGFCVVNSDFF
jgi:hypothetical protein